MKRQLFLLQSVKSDSNMGYNREKSNNIANPKLEKLTINILGAQISFSLIVIKY